MARNPRDDGSGFLSTLPAGREHRRLALFVVALSAAIFLATAPFAKVPMPQVWAFIPIYQSAFVVNDLITAILLVGQFRILRSRALLILASAYLFTALMAAAHGLTFPGLFSHSGLLGAGPQTTAWLYMFWHGGFPLLVIVYATLDDERDALRGRESTAILAGLAAVLVAAAALTLVATAGQRALPAIMEGNKYTPAMIIVVSNVWVLSFIALAALWRRHPLSVLDLWLMVVICAWLFDIALAAVLNAGRFDLGFYAGRIYGLLAASFVLAVLLLENGRLHARLVDALAGERRARERVQQQTSELIEKANELMVVNNELEAFSYSVSHDLKAPVRHVEGLGGILEERYAARLDDEGRRLLGLLRESSRRMGQLIDDLLAFSRLGREPLRTRRLQMEDLVAQTIEDLRRDCGSRRIDFAVSELGVVEADPALLKQVIVNLLSNAIKFTRGKDPAVVEVGCHRRPDSSGGSVFYIKDNGAGFDMRYAQKLFGVFQRLHSGNEYEGTGIGLAIVQRVIARHGGRVWAESEPGKGATFYFELPLGSKEHPLPEPRTA